MSEPEAAERERRGTWWQRFLIWTFSVALALLFYWLLGFVLQDIGNLPGPDWNELEAERLDPALRTDDRAAEQRAGRGQTADRERRAPATAAARQHGELAKDAEPAPRAAADEPGAEDGAAGRAAAGARGKPAAVHRQPEEGPGAQRIAGGTLRTAIEPDRPAAGKRCEAESGTGAAADRVQRAAAGNTGCGSRRSRLAC